MYHPQDSIGSIVISQVKILNYQNNEQLFFYTGETLKVQIEYLAHQAIDSLEVGIAIHRQDGLHITGPNTAFFGLEIKVEPGSGGVIYTIPSVPLLEGLYNITVALVNRDGNIILDHRDRYYPFRIENRGHKVTERYGLLTMNGEWRLL
jgi:lipopolysaccharide transport system ATP-binding protein